ncbi:carboxypeptidase-like regulatory domain-containing protein [Parabacteroides sp. 52]|uniref:carboxypeptidase-like regulatory domain-containing protein n=1 Tax=unclassified Parabacteroides TaxID=2649774 RepID=UPI0013D37BA4|nr:MULTISPECIES: carboxypeptidase-like regulatory domain-containing protein [unclassified Parabacteroides]MDH6533574.1 hypothetical protein [Parabacteroides sp. PM5-20]NDV54326.1 carboxypeptidase-like regulatory domain-containing protein [Parabacteroides sp. 52]
MRQTASYTLLLCFWGFLLFLTTSSLKADNEDVLSRLIPINKGKGSIYKMLGQITDHSGYLFIYDSNLIENDKEVKIKTGTYTIRAAIHLITGNDNIGLKVIGNHILIYKPDLTLSPIHQTLDRSPENDFLTIEGVILNRYTSEPIPFATVGISQAAIGTVTNQNGEFRFRFPDSLRKEPIQFSHIGFIPQEIESNLIVNGHHRISLEPKVISLQEIIVRLVNPQKLLEDMLERRKLNNAPKPVYHTTFYREGVEHKKKLNSLTEGVFRIYKTPFSQPESSDQVKLLKMRRIIDQHERDTVIAKFKSGIHASLMLDPVKHLPDFLTHPDWYDYVHSDITVKEGRLANVIVFEQRKGITEPLYKGEIYIDAENSALLGISFHIHPAFVKKAAGMFIEKKSKKLSVTPQKISYTVSYKAWNGVYYINHIRGDLFFKVRQRRKLFHSTLHTWFEMVTSKTDTLNVSRFTRQEVFHPHTIFAETPFTYDKRFWEDFNIIPPEEKLSDALHKISSKIEMESAEGF